MVRQDESPHHERTDDEPGGEASPRAKRPAAFSSENKDSVCCIKQQSADGSGGTSEQTQAAFSLMRAC